MDEMQKEREILRETAISLMWCTEDIMHVQVKPGAVITAAHAFNDLDRNWNDLFDGPYGMMIDMRGIKYIDREARQYYARRNNPDSKTAAVALVIDSALSRIIANFFIGFNKAVRPVKIFNDHTEAEKWLKTVI